MQKSGDLVKETSAIMLFRDGRITSGMAASMAGHPARAFPVESNAR